MLLERERWERTQLAPYPIWSSVLRSACKGGILGTAIVAGWRGFIAAANAGTTTAWLVCGLFFVCAYVAVVAMRGKSIRALFAGCGPVSGIALFLAPFANELARVNPAEYLLTAFLVVVLAVIPKLAEFSIRVKRFV